MSGGDLYCKSWLYNQGAGTQTMNISGGTLNIDRLPMNDGVCNHSGGTINNKGYYNEYSVGGGIYNGSGTAHMIFLGTSTTGTYRYINLYNDATEFNDVTIVGNDLFVNSNSSEEFDIDGDFTISGGGLITMNSKTMNLAGDWSNSGTFTHGNNRVIFDGVNQQINGNTTDFYDVTFSNTTTTLGVNTNITNAVTLTSGKVVLGAYNLALGTTSANVTLNGGTSANYFNASSTGVLRQYINSLTSYFYPVGDATNYSPITNISINSGTLTNAYIDVNVTDAVHAELGTNTDFISRYWTVSPSGISGTVDYDISYQYITADVTGNDANLYPVKYGDIGGTDHWAGPTGTGTYYEMGAGSVAAVTNILTWTGLATFSDFTGVDKDGDALPIELINFEGICKESIINLYWSTSAEINNDYFTVERSYDGHDFDYLGIVQGAGNSPYINNYQYTDFNVLAKQYYQLKQTDFDGNFSYSEIISVACKQEENEIGIYAIDDLIFINNFATYDSNEEIMYSIIDQTGRLLSRKLVVCVNGQMKINISHLSSGLYHFSLYSGDDVITKKIVKTD